MSIALLGGCGGETTTTAAPDAATSRGFWRLDVNHQALLLSTVAPYDTVRLVATPLNAFGVPLSAELADSTVTVFAPAASGDTTFTVSADGLLRALVPVTHTRVIVRTTVGGVTRSVSIPITITSTTPEAPPARLSLQLAPSDTLTMNGSDVFALTLSAQVLDAQGGVIADAPMVFQSSDSLKIGIDATGTATQAVHPSGPGTVMLYAATTAYGKPFLDSIPVHFVAPIAAFITTTFRTPRNSTTPIGEFTPPEVTIRAGGFVIWVNMAGVDVGAPDIDVVFDDPAAAVPSNDPMAQSCDPGGSGNIPSIGKDTTQACWNLYRFRAFLTPGRYPFHSAKYGSRGTVVVVP